MVHMRAAVGKYNISPSYSAFGLYLTDHMFLHIKNDADMMVAQLALSKKQR